MICLDGADDDHIVVGSRSTQSVTSWNRLSYLTSTLNAVDFGEIYELVHVG